jgi:hypothetical protein
MSRYAKQFAYATLPTATLSDTFPATGVNTGGLDLSSLIGFTVAIKVSEDVTLRAGASAPATGSVATATDYPFTADRDYFVNIDKSTKWVSVAGAGTSGTIYVAKTTGI